MINEVTLTDRIHRARDRYLAVVERQTRALAEIPAELDPLTRLVTIDGILRECSDALDTLAEELPDPEVTRTLGPELCSAIEEFRDSIEVVRKTVTPSRMPILAGIAELRPGRN